MKSIVIGIEDRNSDATLNIALDTLLLKKQCIIFVNTKKSAESVAEKLSQIILKDKKYNYRYNINLSSLEEISAKILNVLPTPTKQCRKLAELIKYGVAFHHSGLVSEQRKVIEDGFRSGLIKVIAATPTLAIGMDLPAFRVIIRDLKRFGLWGMQYISVLEYLQQAGRAGRPSYDTHGEAICIATDNSEKNELKDMYIDGLPEAIVSKLAVEPIMRTYILSIIASAFVRTISELETFFSETFYAKHYGDTEKLNQIILKIIDQLTEWGFISIGDVTNIDNTFDNNVSNNVFNDANKKVSKKDLIENSKDFVSASKLSFKKSDSKNNLDKKLFATLLGHRVSELYLDPYTAHNIIESLKLAVIKKSQKLFSDYSLIHLICTCLELRPLLRVKSKEIDDIVEKINVKSELMLTHISEMFDDDYEDFLNSVKTAEFFFEWLDEKDEEYLFEKYDVRPGEIHSKKERADWLLYSSEELSKLLKLHDLIKDISKVRFRLKYGAREELIPLLQLKNIGRARARKLFDNRIRDVSDIKNVDFTTLSQLIGKTVALDIKKQVGQELSDEKVVIKENKRKGQINLNDYN
jgi:helicase